MTGTKKQQNWIVVKLIIVLAAACLFAVLRVDLQLSPSLRPNVAVLSSVISPSLGKQVKDGDEQPQPQPEAEQEPQQVEADAGEAAAESEETDEAKAAEGEGEEAVKEGESTEEEAKEGGIIIEQAEEGESTEEEAKEGESTEGEVATEGESTEGEVATEGESTEGEEATEGENTEEAATESESAAEEATEGENTEEAKEGESTAEEATEGESTEEVKEGESTEDPYPKHAQQIRDYRNDLLEKCLDESVSNDDYKLLLKEMFHPPEPQEASEEEKSTLEEIANTQFRQCRLVILDFGANIGDSLGKFIDSGLYKCENRSQYYPQYDLDGGQITKEYIPGPKSHFHYWNTMALFVQNRLAEFDYRPEDFCYVGVEGNPVFTQRLKVLERQVMNTEPRPVRNAKFLTDSVGAGKDGPTVLFLDTVNARHNFWGSSIVDTHIDVVKSAEKSQNKTMIEAHVQGWTLSTLLDKTTMGPTRDTKHVIVKMDIEGGEYAVLNEAVEKLCTYVANGVPIDLLTEFHGPKHIGKDNPDEKYFKEVTKQRLEECNVHFPNLGRAGRK